MRLSSLSLPAVLLLCTSLVFAQHSSGGGGGSSGGGSSGSSSSGGGSHGGGGGSSGGSSGGGHSSGGGGSHSSGGSSSRGGSASRSGSGTTSRSTDSQAPKAEGSRVVLDHETAHQVAEMIRAGRSLDEIREVVRARTNVAPDARILKDPHVLKAEQPQKRGFFSLLRHPFRKPQARLPRPVCIHQPCRVCPTGQLHAGGGCVSAYVAATGYPCSIGDVRNGSACFLQTPFLDPCSGLHLALDRQAQRMRTATSARDRACTAGGQDCADLTNRAQSEASLYQTLQDRYQQCRLRSFSYANGYRYVGRPPSRPWIDTGGVETEIR